MPQKKDPLVGKRVTSVGRMDDELAEAEGWSTHWGSRQSPEIRLSDGTVLYASQDEEGNGPGVIFGMKPDGTLFSVQPPYADFGSKKSGLRERRIIAVRRMSPAEMRREGWETDRPPPVIELFGGRASPPWLLYPARDQEGNGPGALFGVGPNGNTFTLIA